MPLYLSFIFMITHHLPSISIMTFHLRSIFLTTRHLIGGVQYMTMAQGVDSNAATITGPNGQQQPAYYVQQPVYLDQNGQPVYYRVGTFSLSHTLPLSIYLSIYLSLSLSLLLAPTLSPLLSPTLSPRAHYPPLNQINPDTYSFLLHSYLPSSFPPIVYSSSQSKWSIPAARWPDDIRCPHTAGRRQSPGGSSSGFLCPI